MGQTNSVSACKDKNTFIINPFHKGTSHIQFLDGEGGAKKSWVNSLQKESQKRDKVDPKTLSSASTRQSVLLLLIDIIHLFPHYLHQVSSEWS